jgi:hypothetical protein
MDALIALNRRELSLQAELDDIRRQKVALLATFAAPAPLLTPTKVKAAAAFLREAPPAPKKAAAPTAAAAVSDSEGPSVARKITIRRKSESSVASTASAASAPAPSTDSAVKHWKAFKKAKADQIAAAQLTSGKPWGKARVKTAIQNAYQLEHPANAAALDQLQKAKEASKAPRAPSEWLQYVAAVKAELGCSHHDAMVEAGRRRRAAAEEA